MTPRLLDHPLILKYFGCHCWGKPVFHAHEMEASYRILLAMEEPINKGERYLLIDSEVFKEKIAESNTFDHGKHLGALRLPDQFQPERKPKELICEQGSCPCNPLPALRQEERMPPSTECPECKQLHGFKREMSHSTVGCECHCHPSNDYACACYKKPDPAKCDHSGLKRYCGDAIYCENCKFDISKEMAECTLPVAHDGLCKKPGL